MNCSNHYEAHEICQEFVVSGCDAPEVFELIKQTLDNVSLFVDRPVTRVRPEPIVARWNDGCGTQIKDGIVEMLRIISPVCDHIAWLIALDEFSPEQNLAPVSRAGNKPQGQPQTVTHAVQLGCQPSLGAPDPLGFRAPFLRLAPLAC